MSLARVETRTTTVRIPVALYQQLKDMIGAEKLSGSKVSLNDAIVSAIKVYVKIHTRRKIDAAFAGMAEDANYQKEATLLAEDFEPSDWESLGIREEDLIGDFTDAANLAR
jgi:hypothetical protein